MTYEKEVWRWGSANPWHKRYGRRVMLNHKTKFAWADVRTDGKGNLLAIDGVTALERKPCFGRPEYFFRHGRKAGPTIKTSYATLKSTASRCGRCPIYDACMKLNLERLDSCPPAKAALIAFRDGQVGRKRSYTGPKAGRLWEAFKRAIADHGPWSSFNDAALEALKAAKDATVREADRRRAKRWYAARRATNHTEEAPNEPMPAAVFKGIQHLRDDINAHRDRRRDLLRHLRANPDAPPSIRKLADHSCEIMADVWRAKATLDMEGREVTVPNVLAFFERHHISYPISGLRVRLYADLKRLNTLERDHRDLWPRVLP